MKHIQIPHARIDELRIEFDKHVPLFDDFQWQSNKHYFKKVFNIDQDSGIQTARRRIYGPVTELVADSVKQFGFDKIERCYMKFARGYLPIAMHVDVPAHNVEEDGWSIMIPLTFSNHIKTIAFTEKVTEPIFDYWIESQDWTARQKKNNLREKFNLKNAYYDKPEIVDYMEVDGIGDWLKGNVFCFRRSNPHCSTNFRTLGLPYKDYIIIQTDDKLHGSPR